MRTEGIQNSRVLQEWVVPKAHNSDRFGLDRYEVKQKVERAGGWTSGFRSFLLTVLSGGFALLSENVRAGWRGKKIVEIRSPLSDNKLQDLSQRGDTIAKLILKIRLSPEQIKAIPEENVIPQEEEVVDLFVSAAAYFNDSKLLEEEQSALRGIMDDLRQREQALLTIKDNETAAEYKARVQSTRIFEQSGAIYHTDSYKVYNDNLAKGILRDAQLTEDTNISALPPDQRREKIVLLQQAMRTHATRATYHPEIPLPYRKVQTMIARLQII